MIKERGREPIFVAGIDIGSVATKSVILDESQAIIGFNIMPVGAIFRESGKDSFRQALSAAGIREEEVSYIVSTGYGRTSLRFAHHRVTEITCHAKGVHKLFPSCRTVIDIGGQDSKAISINDLGNVKNFAMNDRCAAGTGRWLEVIARVLNLSLDKMGELALRAKKEIRISSVCTVFAESEVISYMTGGAQLEDVLGGVHRAIVERVVNSLVLRVGIVEEVALTGGVAKNIAIRREIEKAIGTKVSVPDEPQLTGALGAALIGLEIIQNKNKVTQSRLTVTS